MSKLDELRAAAMAGKSIADYDHEALARYVTALNPLTVIALIDVAEATVRLVDAVNDDCDATQAEFDAAADARSALDKLL